MLSHQDKFCQYSIDCYFTSRACVVALIFLASEGSQQQWDILTLMYVHLALTERLTGTIVVILQPYLTIKRTRVVNINYTGWTTQVRGLLTLVSLTIIFGLGLVFFLGICLLI